MENFNNYLIDIENLDNKKHLEEIFNYVNKHYPILKAEIKWNQPMYTLNNTYIIGFSASKNHISISPESYTIKIFEEKIKEANYTYTNNLFRILKSEKINFKLIDDMIKFNIKDKKDSKTFWR